MIFKYASTRPLRPATSIMVQVTGDHRNFLLVESENAGASRIEGKPVLKQRAMPHYTRRSFWIGLPVILFFAIICWMGVRYAAGQISTERIVYQHGVLITGTVEEKIHYRQADEGEQEHYVTYNFRTPADLTVRNTIRIEPMMWDHLKNNGPIAIRYVPDKPELNLPDGWHMENFYYWAGGIALVGALFFTVVLIGMLIKKLSGGYRGETHPFLGEHSPRQSS